MCKKQKNNIKGVTLVSLVITIILLLILSGITINIMLGENGLLNHTQSAKEEDQKQTASETMQLKITDLQMKNYAEKQKLPTLQELADGLCEDEEMEYVLLSSKSTAQLDKIEVGSNESIYTKIKRYSYEFEINSSLQLASIDGIKIADNNTVSREEYNTLLNELNELKEIVQNKSFAFNKFENVLSVNKSSSTGEGTYYFTTNTNTTRNWNEEYFEYDSTQGFIVKKAGLYSIEMSGHTSSTTSGNVELFIRLNGTDHKTVGRWNNLYSFGQLVGTVTMYFKER